MKTIIVTRHEALVQYIREIGLADESSEVVEQATSEQIKGKHVIGVLPLHLAAEAARVTTVPLSVPPELRGQELGIDQVRELAGAPRTFSIREIEDKSDRVITWSDKPAGRGRLPGLLLIDSDGEVRNFRGSSIPGVCAVLDTAYTKDGKWSHTTFRIELAPHVRAVAYRQGWGSGRTAEGLKEALRASSEDPEDLAHALGVNVKALVRAIAVIAPKQAEVWIKRREEIASLDQEPPAPEAPRTAMAEKLRAAGLL